MTILVADDSEKNRELLRTVLGHLGHTVTEAANGREAVAAAARTGPDLMIFDLQMPLLDGFGAMREVRAMDRFRDTPVLALTAYAMEGDREKALEAGFAAYLTKPLRLADLRAEMARWAARL
jgi:CheY-like chemotaxis protein